MPAGTNADLADGVVSSPGPSPAPGAPAATQSDLADGIPGSAGAAPATSAANAAAGRFSSLAEAQQPQNVTNAPQPGQGRIAYLAQQAATKQKLGLPLEYGEAAASLLEGGAHFVRDLIDPTVPVYEGKDSLINKYIVEPAQQQWAASQADVARSVAAGEGQLGKNMFAARAHEIAGDVPFVGPMAAATVTQALKAHTLSQYVAAAEFGAATAMAAKGAAEGPGGAAEAARGMASDVATAAGDAAGGLTRKSAITDASVNMLEKTRADAQQTVAQSVARAGKAVGASVDRIETEDIANLPEGRTGSIKTAPLHEAIVAAMDDHGIATTAKTPALDIALKDLQNQPNSASVTFAQLKGMRTSVGQLAAGSRGAEAGTLWQIYDAYTGAMAARASALGLDDDFKFYNDVHSTLMDYTHGTRPGEAPSFPPVLSDVMNADKWSSFMDYIRKPSNLPALDAFNKDMSRFGLPENFFRSIVDTTKRTYTVAKNAETGGIGFGGKMRAFTAHPIFAGSAAIAAASATSALGPIGMAGRFIVTLLAAAKAADVADLARAHAEIRKLGGAPSVTGRMTAPTPAENAPAAAPSEGGGGE
jgi:hypothetical protein